MASGVQATQGAGAGAVGHPSFMPQPGCEGCSAASPSGLGNLTYHGGPVMHSVTAYAIFWLPSGYQFDSPSVDPPYTNASDSLYEGLVGRFLGDLSDTAYYSVLQQYPDSSGPAGLSTTFGGSWVDTSPYPNSEGSVANPLQDIDIQAEVARAISLNGWAPRDGNNTFVVFTGLDVYSCAGSQCSYDEYCSYHSAFGLADGQTATYAYVPDPGNSNSEPCLATAATGHPSPNGAAFADSAVNLVAHEEFEAISDPAFNGWYNGDLEHEVADQCLWKFGPLASDGSDVVVDGHPYLVQEMWSNSAGGCYIPATVPTVPLIVSYRVDGASPGPSPPVFAYWSGGLLKNATLENGPRTLQVDMLTAWGVTKTLAGSGPGYRWQTPASTAGTVRSAETLTFTYYAQCLMTLAFEASGGTGYSAPSVSAVQFGSTETLLVGGSYWLDAGSNLNFSALLPGSGPDERWSRPSAGVTVNSPMTVLADYQRQYRVTLRVTDASGSKDLVPSQIQLDYPKPGPSVLPGVTASTAVHGQQAWLDAGTVYTVAQLLWEGADVSPSSGYTITANSPGTVTIAASVYDLEIKVSDYLRLPVSGASATLRMVNGTTVRESTGSGGTIFLPSVPLGPLDGTVSYLGYSQALNVHVAASGEIPVTLPLSFPDLSLVVAASAAVAAYLVVRRKRVGTG